MKIRLEHGNLTVRDIDEEIRFLQAAFPEFKIRFDARQADGTGWVHVGTDDTYITLNPAHSEPEKPWRPYSDPGVNHLAYVVPDVDALRERLHSAGFKNSIPAFIHPSRKRVYFHDPDGHEWEFIQYLTDDPAKRNDYTIPETQEERDVS